MQNVKLRISFIYFSVSSVNSVAELFLLEFFRYESRNYETHNKRIS